MDVEQLRQVLAEHWRNSSLDGDLPVVHKEESSFAGMFRYYVFWNAWAGLPQRERSRLIMENVRAHEGEETARLVTIAMGLTHNEVEGLGIRVADLQSAA
jgi:hypothetical protein